MDSNFENPAVQHFISCLEGVINRMAANSARGDGGTGTCPTANGSMNED